MGDSLGIELFKTDNETIHWRASLQNELDEVTEEKIELASKLGVPAVLFTPQQVSDIFDELAARELDRYKDETYHDVLYMLLLQGGAYISQEIFRRFGPEVPKYIVNQDSYAIKFDKNMGPSKMRITKTPDEGTRLTDKHVVLLDSAVRSGRVARTVHEQFTNPQWTVHQHLGGVATKVELRTLTVREESDLSTFSPSCVDFGFITPSGLITAGSGSVDYNGAHRWSPGIFLASQQPKSTKDSVAETLEMLGPRAVMSVDQIEWRD